MRSYGQIHVRNNTVRTNSAIEHECLLAQDLIGGIDTRNDTLGTSINASPQKYYHTCAAASSYPVVPLICPAKKSPSMSLVSSV